MSGPWKIERHGMSAEDYDLELRSPDGLKIKDTAMGKFFEGLSHDERVSYVLGALYEKRNDNSNVFWQIIETCNLTAATPRDLATQVVDQLMEFGLDQEDPK